MPSNNEKKSFFGKVKDVSSDIGNSLFSADHEKIVDNLKASQALKTDEKAFTGWTNERIDFCRSLWGEFDPITKEYEEIIRPGGIGETSHLCVAMGLGRQKSFLDLTTSIGGSFRKLVKDYGLWADGMEPDPDLAKYAMHLSKIRGMSRTAPISPYDIESLKLGALKFHGILAQQLFSRSLDKRKIFATIHQSLKESGHLVFTDFVIPSELSSDDPQLQEFTRSYYHQLHLTTAREFRQILAELDYDIRTFRDYTATYKSQLIYSWNKIINKIKSDDSIKATPKALSQEAKLWMPIFECIGARKLGIVHCHAIRKQLPDEEEIGIGENG